MKKTIILSILFLAFLNVTLKAQGDLSYGIKGGLVSSVFSSQLQKLSGTTESRTAFSIGLFGEMPITDQFGVSVDALYVQEGSMRIDPNYVYFSTKQTAGDGSYVLNKVNSNIVMNCIEFPIKVNYYLPEMSGAAPKVFLGGSLDFINNVTAKNLMSLTYNGGNAIVLSGRDKDKVNSSFKKFNFGLVMGAGVSVSNFTVDISYKIGLKKINDLATYGYQNTYREDFSTNTLFISLGYQLNKLF